MSDAVLLAIITACVGVFTALMTLIGAMFTAYMALKLATIQRQGTEAARNVQEVKVALETTTASQDKKLDAGLRLAKDTHTLVNSNMGVQLRLNAELSRWKAEQTLHPEDLRAAELADKMLLEHQTKQAIVDSGGSRVNAADVAEGAAEVANKAGVVATQAAEVANKS